MSYEILTYKDFDSESIQKYNIKPYAVFIIEYTTSMIFYRYTRGIFMMGCPYRNKFVLRKTLLKKKYIITSYDDIHDQETDKQYIDITLNKFLYSNYYASDTIIDKYVLKKFFLDDKFKYLVSREDKYQNLILSYLVDVNNNPTILNYRINACYYYTDFMYSLLDFYSYNNDVNQDIFEKIDNGIDLFKYYKNLGLVSRGVEHLLGYQLNNKQEDALILKNNPVDTKYFIDAFNSFINQNKHFPNINMQWAKEYLMLKKLDTVEKPGIIDFDPSSESPLDFIRFLGAIENHHISHDYMEIFWDHTFRYADLSDIVRANNLYHNNVSYYDDLINEYIVEAKNLFLLNNSQDKNKIINMGKWTLPFEDKIYENGSITFLKNAQSLKDEGKDMNHCVGSYLTSCLSMKSFIAHIEADTYQSTAELGLTQDNKLMIVQHRTYSNGNPTQSCKDILTQYLQEIEINNDDIEHIKNNIENYQYTTKFRNLYDYNVAMELLIPHIKELLPKRFHKLSHKKILDKIKQ